MKSLVENIIREEVRNVVKEYFGSFVELQKGPVFQVHAAATRNGLTKAVRKTKRSQLADMRRNDEVFFKAPRGITIQRWHSRWNGTRQQMQKITGFKWSLRNDQEQGGIWITRTR